MTGRRIKVAHVTTVAMGQKYLVLNQMKALRSAGYDVVGISAPGPEISALDEAGIRHIPIPFNRKSFTPVADLWSLLWLCKTLAAERPTIVHTHNPKPTLYAQMAARIVGVPIVVNTLHGYVFQDRTHPKLRRAFIAIERLAARWADAILSVNSEDVRTAIIEKIAGPEKIVHLGGGIDLARFTPGTFGPDDLAGFKASVGIREGSLVVGFIGRLVREKGLLELLGAAKIVLQERPETQFVIIGSPDVQKKDSLTFQIAKEYGISKSCLFLGHRDDTPKLYSCMDLLVLPSHREGLPLVPMEACAMGIPCIVTDIRGCREVITDQVNGLVVPRADIKALAQAIRRILENADERALFGRRAREVAVERFDEKKVIGKIISTYERLLSLSSRDIA